MSAVFPMLSGRCPQTEDVIYIQPQETAVYIRLADATILIP